MHAQFFEGWVVTVCTYVNAQFGMIGMIHSYHSCTHNQGPHRKRKLDLLLQKLSVKKFFLIRNKSSPWCSPSLLRNKNLIQNVLRPRNCFGWSPLRITTYRWRPPYSVGNQGDLHGTFSGVPNDPCTSDCEQRLLKREDNVLFGKLDWTSMTCCRLHPGSITWVRGLRSMLSLNVRTPVPENNHTSHRVQDPSLIRISQRTPMMFIVWISEYVY